jgi:SNF2 family DNA or RNA helicase
LKTEVASELPPRQEKILYCELGDEQRMLYERVKQTYRSAVLNRVDEMGGRRSTLSVLEALMRLRQACCDPGLLPFPEARSVKQSAKLELLIETLEETIASGHRTLVFSQWTSLLARVIPRLDEAGWTYLYLDGKTVHRHRLVKQWNDPSGPPVFLISLRAGGSGLNLTGADHVIHLDPWWNPAVEQQATDRAHRIGQDRPVVAYKLVARNTIEEKVLALQARKKDLFDQTIDKDRFTVQQLSRDDIEAFFRSEEIEFNGEVRELESES